MLEDINPLCPRGAERRGRSVKGSDGSPADGDDSEPRAREQGKMSSQVLMFLAARRVTALGFDTITRNDIQT